MCAVATSPVSLPIGLPEPYLPLIMDLGGTKSYRSRRASYVAYTDPRAEYDGLLTITVRRSPGVSEVDTYAVQETRLPFAATWREWLLLNITDHEQTDVYRVQIGNRGSFCTCKGFQCQRTCKHVDAITKTIEEGGLPDRREPEPVAVTPAIPAKPARVICPICSEPTTDGRRAHKSCVRYQWDLDHPTERDENDRAFKQYMIDEAARIERGEPTVPYTPPHPVPTELS